MGATIVLTQPVMHVDTASTDANRQGQDRD